MPRRRVARDLGGFRKQQFRSVARPTPKSYQRSSPWPNRPCAAGIRGGRSRRLRPALAANPRPHAPWAKPCRPRTPSACASRTSACGSPADPETGFRAAPGRSPPKRTAAKPRRWHPTWNISHCVLLYSTVATVKVERISIRSERNELRSTPLRNVRTLNVHHVFDEAYNRSRYRWRKALTFSFVSLPRSCFSRCSQARR